MYVQVDPYCPTVMRTITSKKETVSKRHINHVKKQQQNQINNSFITKRMIINL